MIALDGNQLTISDFHQIVFGRKEVRLASEAHLLMTQSRDHVLKAIKTGESLYSINTGFGVLSNVRIPPESLDELQVNLVRSHSVGVGPLHSEEESRALVLLRANVLAKGYSGVRPVIAQTLVHLGIDLTGVVTRASLEAGLRFAMESMHLPAATSNEHR